MYTTVALSDRTVQFLFCCELHKVTQVVNWLAVADRSRTFNEVERTVHDLERTISETEYTIFKLESKASAPASTII